MTKRVSPAVNLPDRINPSSTLVSSFANCSNADLNIEAMEANEFIDETAFDRADEYLSAQRAAVESVMIGRETLETAVRQGEQLRNAENLADDTEYKLDRANRLLKGMTWSGWIANKFSKDIEPPEFKPDADVQASMGPPRVYENAPEFCYSAAQAIQNYHCNIDVLEECETNEQRDTCKIICDNMYALAHKELKLLLLKEGGDKESRLFASRLQDDLNTLRKRQRSSEQLVRTPTKVDATTSEKETLFQIPSASSQSTKSPIEAFQDDHLDSMARHLDELGLLATNLNASLGHHADTLESLDTRMDSNLVKSNAVTRRTDRLIQKKSWKKTKPVFVSSFSIQHLQTGKYLSISTSNAIVLSSKFNETCIFGLWNRQGNIFGLQSKYSTRWIGQNLLGNLVCTATKFDRREEWDADGDDWSSTPLICASAGWGAGGYLLVNTADETISIGGGGVEDRKKAAIWCIKDQHKDEKSPRAH
eukprot:scaffold4222_cov115-Cylindrotheca_fusiformis.AAC.13